MMNRSISHDGRVTFKKHPILAGTGSRPKPEAKAQLTME